MTVRLDGIQLNRATSIPITALRRSFRLNYYEMSPTATAQWDLIQDNDDQNLQKFVLEHRCFQRICFQKILYLSYYIEVKPRGKPEQKCFLNFF